MSALRGEPTAAAPSAWPPGATGSAGDNTGHPTTLDTILSPSHLRVAARSSNTSTASSFWSWTLSTGRQLAAASPLLRRTHVRQARRGRHGCNRDRRMDLRPDTPPPTDPALILGWHNHQRLPATGRQLAAASPPFRQTHVRQARRGRHGRNRNRRTLLRLDAPLPADHPPLLGWHVNQLLPANQWRSVVRSATVTAIVRTSAP